LLNLSGFNLVNYWAANADALIIGKYYSNYDLGIYKRAFRLMQLMLSMILGLFGTVVYPSLMKFKSAGGDFRKEYGSILGVISLISYPLSAIMILIPKEMVWLLWGENWLMVADFLPYFGILIMFQSLMVNNGQIFILLEKEKTFMYFGIFESLLRIIAMIIGAFFSVKGILIARVISYLVLIIPLALYIGFYKSFNFSIAFIIRFWLPKTILGYLIFIFIFIDNQNSLIICTLIYLVHIVYYQRKDLFKLKSILLNKYNND
jgi:PST family polysaccharide transporter